MPADLKPVLARQMEVYAGFLAHTDAQVGRLVQALEDLEILDGTLVYYIIGDNGASAEGTVNGSFNEAINFNGMSALETPDFLRARIAELGTPTAYNHYAVGWAHALCTPYQWTKQVASHWGGTRNGTIVHWPARITAAGEVREQFIHVIDVAPTILEAAGLPEPATVHGVTQDPMEGLSMGYSFDDPAAAERHQTQYFEIAGNRGIYHRGWTAVTRHRTPWELLGAKVVEFDDDVWELYGPDDWTQARDLAAEQPEMLHRLQRLWLMEAARHGVLPLDDRGAERFNPDLAGRPQLIRGNTQVLFPGMGHLNENSVINVKNKSHSLTAQIVIPDSRGRGSHPLPGRDGRRLEPVRPRGPAAVLLQPGRPAALLRRLPGQAPGRGAPGADGVRLRRPRPGQGRHRHPLRSTAPRSAAGACPRPSPWSSPATRPPTSAARPAPRSPPTTRHAATTSPARSAGSRSTSTPRPARTT